MSDEWYEAVSATVELSQGDIIADCPLAIWSPVALEGTGDAEALLGDLVMRSQDSIVMTQACDLEQHKIKNVVLCPCPLLSEFRSSWERARRTAGKSANAKEWRKLCDSICKGIVWSMAMLSMGKSGSLSTETRVVQFHEICTMPRARLEYYIAQRGSSRLRLLPPYREHLSQSFARFFMRVGLPVPVSRTW